MLQILVANWIMKIGYARVSTEDQTPALQLAALKKAGCTMVFKDDGLSGATTKRPRPSPLFEEAGIR
jgi:DNA invertase Pin-like site-specific DNA recombinase